MFWMNILAVQYLKREGLRNWVWLSFCSDIGCLNWASYLLSPGLLISRVSERESVGGLGRDLRPTVYTCNLADTMWHKGLIICFNVDLLTMVSWNAVLRILTRLSKCFSWLGMSRALWGQGGKTAVYKGNRPSPDISQPPELSEINVCCL